MVDFFIRHFVEAERMRFLENFFTYLRFAFQFAAIERKEVFFSLFGSAHPNWIDCIILTQKLLKLKPMLTIFIPILFAKVFVS